MVKVHDLTEDRKIKFTADPGVRELVDEFIAEQNVIMAPAKLTITALCNEALRFYMNAKRAERRAA